MSIKKYLGFDEPKQSTEVYIVVGDDNNYMTYHEYSDCAAIRHCKVNKCDLEALLDLPLPVNQCKICENRKRIIWPSKLHASRKHKRWHGVCFALHFSIYTRNTVVGFLKLYGNSNSNNFCRSRAQFLLLIRRCRFDPRRGVVGIAYFFVHPAGKIE